MQTCIAFRRLRLASAVFLAAFSVALPQAARAGAEEDMLQAYKAHRISEYAQSIPIWRRLAEDGQVDAQYNLGVIYHHGDGVAQDFQEALMWYGRAAQNGDVEAQRALGSMYMRGQGVAQNEKVGMRFMMLSKALAHHEHMHAAEKWSGQLERAIWQDERDRLELLYVQSLENSDLVVADLRRRAGLDVGEQPSMVAQLR